VGFIVVGVNVVLPSAFLAWLWRHRGGDKLQWLLKTASVGALISWLFVTARWDWTGYWLRYLVLASWPLAALVSYRRGNFASLRLPATRKQRIEAASYVLPTLLFGYWLASALLGYRHTEDAVALEFPLRDGTYYVAHGGSALQVNHHRVSRAQLFALDITRLDSVGLRAGGVTPRANERFHIFREPVLSPCDGEIVAAHYGEPDDGMFAADPRNPAGNFVAIRCNDVDVFLAHLKQGFTSVRPGDAVRTGEPIGLVGNSGNSTEPHLHIHAREVDPSASVHEGVGVPMIFDGRFLVRNSLVH
jgi:hypothetical protein